MRALDVKVSHQELHLGMPSAAIGAVFVGTACETTTELEFLIRS